MVTTRTKHTNTTIKRLSILLWLCISSVLTTYGQTIHGKVLDEFEKPFPGANISLNGNAKTVSNFNGQFTLNNLSSKNFQVTITAIGYQTTSVSGKTDTVSRELLFVLTPDVQELDEVIVNSNIEEELKRTESLSIQHVNQEFLKETNASTLMQALSTVPGINSMDVGTGISKPMIRGMGYYRVVIAQNGINQEGQQWSSHHGISVDQSSVGHVEIIKGPASLQYGSGAIGGVINILPERIPTKDGVSGEVSMTAKSNTQWLGGSAELSLRKKDFYSHIDITYNSFGDFIIPEAESYVLPTLASAVEASHEVELGNQVYNTAGEERAVSATAGIVKPWGDSYFEINYYGTKTGFFDWQGLQRDSTREMHRSDRRDFQFPYQQVNNYAIRHFINRYFKDNKLQLGIGYQYNDSKEFDNFIDRSGNRTEAFNYYRDRGNLDIGLSLHTYSANVHYSINNPKRHAIKVGLNTQYQTHDFDGYNHILPAYKRLSGGLFLTHKFTITDQWILNSGARIDFTHVNMDESISPDPEDTGDLIFNPDFNKTYPGTAFSAGVNYLPSQNTILKANIGKSFRVPSVYELGAYGLHRHGGRVEKGNIENQPEQAWEVDLGLEQKWNDITLSISPFLNYFTNYLFLNPTAEVNSRGQIFEYRQTKAMLSGSELSANYRYKNKLDLSLNAEYVYAVNLDLSSALPFTPPANLRTAVKYVLKDINIAQKNKVGIELISVAAQNNTIPNELSTPGYHSVNLSTQSEIIFGKQKINLMLKVRNLLNASYYNHISFYRRMRIPEAGRDIQLFIKVPIN